MIIIILKVDNLHMNAYISVFHSIHHASLTLNKNFIAPSKKTLLIGNKICSKECVNI